MRAFAFGYEHPELKLRATERRRVNPACGPIYPLPGPPPKLATLVFRGGSHLAREGVSC